MTAPAARPGPHTLVAGIGNIFLGDDGFGVEAVRRLAARELPDGVEAVDIGVRGVHLAYRLLDGYRTVVLIDAMARGGAPGTVYLVDDARADPEPGQPEARVGQEVQWNPFAQRELGTALEQPRRHLTRPHLDLPDPCDRGRNHAWVPDPLGLLERRPRVSQRPHVV